MKQIRLSLACLLQVVFLVSTVFAIDPRSFQGPINPLLTIAGASANSSDGFYAIDGVNSTRWTELGSGVALTLDLGSVSTVGAINIDFYQPSRTYTFDVAVSIDGVTWQKIAVDYKSPGDGVRRMIRYDLSDRAARFIRYVSKGNNEAGAESEASIYELTLESSNIWNEWRQNPDAHMNIPNGSYAGYFNGEADLPILKNSISVVDQGAIGDGVFDSYPAFVRAIKIAIEQGGGVVTIPAGTYYLSSILKLKDPNIVLRGAGSNLTRIVFNRPLEELAFAYFNPNGTNRWSMNGGLIWVAPKNVWDVEGRLVDQQGRAVQSDPYNVATAGWGDWRLGDHVTNLTAVVLRGSKTIPVSSTAGIEGGDWLLMRVGVEENRRGWMRVGRTGGHPVMEAYDWFGLTKWPFQDANNREDVHPVQVKRVLDGAIELTDPVVWDELRPSWNIRFHRFANNVLLEGVGIEDLAIETLGSTTKPHHEEDGYNPVFFNQCINCWMSNVELINGQNGIIAKNILNFTAEDIVMSGTVTPHHAFNISGRNALIQRVDIRVKPYHGLSISSTDRAVFSEITMQHGTFDGHGQAPCDIIFTDINLANNDGVRGGFYAGPMYGARVGSWNNIVGGTNGDLVYQPADAPYGFFVNMLSPRSALCNGAPCADKSHAEASLSIDMPNNLFKGQVEERKSNSDWVHLVSPVNGTTVNEGVNLTLEASVNYSGGSNGIERVEFFSGSEKLGEDASYPYAIDSSFGMVGNYEIFTRAVLNDGRILTSPYGVNITVKPDLFVLPVTAIAASYEESLYPKHFAVDGNNTPESRWRHNFNGSWLALDTHSSTIVKSALRLSLHRSERRSYRFDVEVSQDGVTWLPHRLGLASSVDYHVDNFELFTIPPTRSRYLRIVGRGVSDGTNWSNIIEVQVLAEAQPATPSALPTVTPTPVETNTPIPVATSTPIPVATNTPTPVATSTPIPVATNTPVPTVVATVTSIPVKIPLTAFKASYEYPGFAKEYAVDGINDDSSRWKHEGNGAYIAFDTGVNGLEKVQIKIAFFRSSTRWYSFDIEASEDGSNWSKLQSGYISTLGTPIEILEPFTIPATRSRFIRIVARGNSVGNSVINLREVEIMARP